MNPSQEDEGEGKQLKHIQLGQWKLQLAAFFTRAPEGCEFN